MKRNQQISVAAAMVFAVVIGLCKVTFAGTAYQKALAAVAVAVATLEIAEEQPLLPDTPRTNATSTAVDAVPKQETAESDAELSSTLIPDTVVIETPAAPNRTKVVANPMRIELTGSVPISDVLPAQLVIGGWERGCPHCERLERDIRSLLTPLHWEIGDQNSDQIQFVHLPLTEAVPQIVLYQNGTEIKRWQGYQDPGMLSRELRDAWDRAPDHFDRAMAAGVAGKIHAKAAVHSSLEWWRQRIGQGRPVTFRWDRTGAGSFALLANGDWSAEALFGPSGRIELTAPEPASLPVDQVGFSYRIVGQDVSIDLDPITVSGLAAKLGPSANQLTVGSAPVQFVDPVTVWSVFAVLREVWQLLHPTCDLQLGGTIAGTVVMSNDLLVIDFQKCPSIRLVALFTFQLQVKRIEINESSVRLVFAGSRLIKERSFSIE